MTKQIDDMTIEEFDEYFDNGGDVSALFEDGREVTRPNRGTQAVNLTLPIWLVNVLDNEAERRSIPRKSIINDWLVDRADLERKQAMTMN